MFPPVFGSWCWKFLHAMAYSYKDHIFTQEESIWMETFITVMFSHLPCPGMCHNAMIYVRNNKPEFVNGNDMVDYLHTYHNLVNTYKNQSIFSKEEAKTSLEIQIGNLGFKLEELEDAFVDDFWFVLLLIAKEIKHQTTLQDFLIASCFALPFNRHVCEDGILVRNVMLDALEDTIHASSNLIYLQPITNMYNNAASHFNESIRSCDEMNQCLTNHFCVPDYSIFVKSQDLHTKNQVKIMEYQKQLENRSNYHQPCSLIRRAQEMLEEDLKKITLLEKKLGIFIQ